MARARRGDHAAYGVLVNAHRDAVYRAAYHVLDDAEEALDVAQETFLKAYEALAGFEGKASFRTWARRIAVNQALNRRRTLRRRGPQRELPEALPDPAAEAPAAGLERAEAELLLRREIAALPEAQALAIRLHDIEGLSYAEIADLTGTKPGTVMSRIHYARLKLRERLAPLLGEEGRGHA